MASEYWPDQDLEFIDELDGTKLVLSEKYNPYAKDQPPHAMTVRFNSKGDVGFRHGDKIVSYEAFASSEFVFERYRAAKFSPWEGEPQKRRVFRFLRAVLATHVLERSKEGVLHAMLLEPHIQRHLVNPATFVGTRGDENTTEEDDGDARLSKRLRSLNREPSAGGNSRKRRLSFCDPASPEATLSSPLMSSVERCALGEHKCLELLGTFRSKNTDPVGSNSTSSGTRQSTQSRKSSFQKESGKNQHGAEYATNETESTGESADKPANSSKSTADMVLESFKADPKRWDGLSDIICKALCETGRL